ncbi:Bug family tripartite tricarboxylate transporter substrate binding protein [Primorskyibacter flagellatus]|uniref:Bug family tripartite tricarboxylate transporter substrate binding protein n=1 Tax=Primorskyibacter flagellatus TaxID=1387277 RepID=UPI003A91C3B4
MNRVALTIGTLAGALGLAGVAQAQAEFPCQTARVIVPYGAGGGSDVHARILVDAANRVGSEPQLQVINITGQGGNTGAREVHEAAPDGCTLLFQHEAILSSYITGRVDFNWDGFTPAAMATVEPGLYAAGPNAPFDSLAKMRDYAAENPGEVLAAASLGSNTHFFLLLIQDKLDIEFNIIGYEGGRERITALLSDTVHVGQVGESDARQYFGGELKPLGYIAEERSETMPDVPTAKEQGVEGLEIASVRGFMLPPDTSDEIAQHYGDLFKSVLEDEKTVSELKRLGAIIDYRGPEEYAAWWQQQSDDWERIARELDIYMAD